ncbi:hypothetical protein PAXRUDRAFT_167113, partial [Paxillus rubicundulus Ve08.2h10]
IEPPLTPTLLSLSTPMTSNPIASWQVFVQEPSQITLDQYGNLGPSHLPTYQDHAQKAGSSSMPQQLHHSFYEDGQCMADMPSHYGYVTQDNNYADRYENHTVMNQNFLSHAEYAVHAMQQHPPPSFPPPLQPQPQLQSEVVQPVYGVGRLCGGEIEGQSGKRPNMIRAVNTMRLQLRKQHAALPCTLEPPEPPHTRPSHRDNDLPALSLVQTSHEQSISSIRYIKVTKQEERYRDCGHKRTMPPHVC